MTTRTTGTAVLSLNQEIHVPTIFHVVPTNIPTLISKTTIGRTRAIIDTSEDKVITPYSILNCLHVTKSATVAPCDEANEQHANEQCISTEQQCSLTVFQRAVEIPLRHLINSGKMFIYIDDITIFSNTFESHLETTKEALNCL